MKDVVELVAHCVNQVVVEAVKTFVQNNNKMNCLLLPPSSPFRKVPVRFAELDCRLHSVLLALVALHIFLHLVYWPHIARVSLTYINK